MKKYRCEYCGEIHDGTHGSGRFCSRFCSYQKGTTYKQKNISEWLKKSYQNIYNIKRYCVLCHQEYLSKDKNRTVCYNCVPKIKRNRIYSRIDTNIMQWSIQKISRKLKLIHCPCMCCGFRATNMTLDIHHIIEKRNGGDDFIDNLTYICPNCHRAVHTNKKLLTSPLVSISSYLDTNNIDLTTIDNIY